MADPEELLWTVDQASRHDKLKTNPPCGTKGLFRVPMLALLVLHLFLLSGKFRISGFEARWILLPAVLLIGLARLRPLLSAGLSIPVRKFLVLLAAYTCSLFVATERSGNAARATIQLVDLTVVFLVVMLAALLFSSFEEKELRFLLLLCSVIGYTYLIGAISDRSGLDGALSAFGGGPNVFVRVLFTGLTGLLIATKRFTSMFRVLMATPFVIGILLSGSRGGVLSALLVLILWMYFNRNRLQRLLFRGIQMTAGVSIALFYLLPTSLIGYLDNRFLKQTLENRYTSGRGVIFRQTWEMFLDNPLLGNGLDSYYANYGKFNGIEYSHNLILASIADGGLISLGLLAALVLFLSRRSGHAFSQSSIALFAALNTVFYLSASNFSGDYYDSRFTWYFAALMLASQLTAGKNHVSATQHGGSQQEKF